jgi:hypothetical protein
MAHALSPILPKRSRGPRFERGWSGEVGGRRTACRNTETITAAGRLNRDSEALSAAAARSRSSKLQPVGEIFAADLLQVQQRTIADTIPDCSWRLARANASTAISK